MSDTRASDSLRRGIETAKAGNKLLARLHLLQAVELAPSDPNCWLWLAWVAESPASAKHSLERLLEEYPNHELAQLGLRWANAMADYQYQDDTSLAQQTAPRVEESLEREARTEEETESSETLEERSSPWFESESIESPATETEEPRFEDDTYFDDAETRSEDRTFFEETEEERSSIEQEPQAAEFTEAEKPQAFEFNNPEEPQAFELAEADGEQESIESNASDETLTESSWWRNNSTPTPASREEKPQPAEEPAAELQNDFKALPEPVAIPEAPEPPKFEPVSEAAAEAGSEEDFPEEEESEFGVTVLVVDDSPTVRKLVSMTMEKNGFSVATAPDGLAALKSISELRPRLILLDITMPRLGGYQLCKLIKKHESTKHIPVIMLSGRDGMFDKVRGKFVGCDDYVTKPFDPDVLVEKVAAQLTEKYGVTAT
jgi:twitching motility two-component system response regulator PilG